METQIVHSTLDLPLLNRMKRICSSMSLTPFQFLMGTLRAFMFRYTNAKDMIIHMINGNRPHADVDGDLGLFADMTPVRITNEFEGSFEQILKLVRDKMAGINEHPLPFDAIVNAVQPMTQSGVFPLGQVVLNYQIHGVMPKFDCRDFTIDEFHAGDVPTACDIHLEAMEVPERGLDLSLEHFTYLYKDSDMERFLDNFITFLGAVIKDHRQPIGEIPMTGELEKKALKDLHWNKPAKSLLRDHDSLMAQIIAQANSHPTKQALLTSDGDSMSYSELYDAAARTAANLEVEGARPGAHVGLLAKPGLHEIIGILGILLCRCGYVPLDPDFAPDRLAFMADDSGSSIVLASDGSEKVINNASHSSGFSSKKVLKIADTMKYGSKKRFDGSRMEDPIYVTYTSVSDLMLLQPF